MAVDPADIAASQIRGYLADLAALRRSRPADDRISALVTAADPLPEDDLLTTAALLLWAGLETAAGLLTNGLLALLRNPVEAELLRTGPAELVPAAVEELRVHRPGPVGPAAERAAAVVLRRWDPLLPRCAARAVGGAGRAATVAATVPQLRLAGEPVPREGLAIHGYARLPVAVG